MFCMKGWLGTSQKIPCFVFLLIYVFSFSLTACAPQVEEQTIGTYEPESSIEIINTVTGTPTLTITPSVSPAPESLESGNEYLMITIEKFQFADTGDSNVGEISISSSVLPLEIMDNRWHVEKKQSQGNHYPFPVGLWQDVKDREMVPLNMPIYLEEWDSTPTNLSIFLYATDNDDWPKWLYLTLDTLATGLKELGNFPGEIVKGIGNLGNDAKKELFNYLFGKTALPAPTFSEDWIGITGYDLTPKIAEKMDLDKETKGIIVQKVDYQSAANKAGLKNSYKTIEVNEQEYLVGSDIITAINSQIISSFSDLNDFLKTIPKSGGKVSITILREGKSQKVDLTLIAKPDSDTRTEIPEVGPETPDVSDGEINEKDIMNPSADSLYLINQIPDDVKKRIVGDTWFTTSIVNHFWREFLEDKGVYEYLNIAEKYGLLSKALGIGMKSMLKYFTDSDVVFQTLIKSDELVHPAAESTSGSEFPYKPNLAPNKANNWGIPEGKNSVTYRICDAQYYKDNRENLKKDQQNLCNGTYVDVKFQKVSAPKKPLEVIIMLNRIKFLDNGEGGSPELFIHTRMMDTNMLETDLIDQLFNEANGHPELLNLDNLNNLDMGLIKSSKRFPSLKYSQQKFYSYPEKKWVYLNIEITPIGNWAVYETNSPFLFFEISIYEDDTGTIFEDSADWIMNYTRLLDLTDVKLNETNKEVIKTKNAQFELLWEVSEKSEEEKPQEPTAAPNSEKPAPPAAFESQTPAVLFLGFNHARFPFNDADARRAFSAAINRNYLADAVNPNDGEVLFIPTSALIPDATWQALLESESYSSTNGIRPSSDLVKNYLNLAYEQGEYQNIQQFDWWPESIRLAYIDTPFNTDIAEVLFKEFQREIGIGIELIPLSENGFMEMMADDEEAPEMFLYFISSTLASPLPYLEYILVPDENASNSPMHRQSSMYLEYVLVPDENADLLRYEDPDLFWQFEEVLQESNPEILFTEALRIEKMLLEDYAVIAPLIHFNASEFDFFSGGIYRAPAINMEAVIPDLPTMTLTPTAKSAPAPTATAKAPTETVHVLPTTVTPSSQLQLDGSCLEVGMDRMGADFSSIELKPAEADPLNCMQLCLEDEKCSAFTYVSPGIQAENAVCWLKNSVPESSSMEGCTSGVREECIADNPQFK